jgi:hypothetical protein
LSNSGRNFRLAFIGIAITAAVSWLWICYCRFPGSPWNDIRLVPAFMAAAGEPVYSLPGQGILTTWMYGPVPLWLAWPVTLAPDAVSALLVAGALNLGLTVVAIALTCFGWPGAKAESADRWLALAATLALWPEPAFRFLQADNPAVAFGLIANLLLITADKGDRCSWRLWLAAASTAAALGCKQTSLGLPLAQIIWLVFAQGRPAALAHLARGFVAVSLLATAAILQFGFKALWFGVVTLPAGLPWAEDLGGRLRENAPHLVLQLGLPLATLLLLKRTTPSPASSLGLPILSWLCALPAGLLGLLSSGGSHNSLQAFALFAPAGFVLLGSQLQLSAGRRLTLATAAIGMTVMMRILAADDAPLRPDTVNLRIATALQAELPGQVWLPWNPLVSYYAEHRFYHAEDGISVRFITGHPVPLAQARAGMPPHFHAIAVPSPNMQSGPASKLIRNPVSIRRLGQWIIWTWPADSSP